MKRAGLLLPPTIPCSFFLSSFARWRVLVTAFCKGVNFPFFLHFPTTVVLVPQFFFLTLFPFFLPLPAGSVAFVPSFQLLSKTFCSSPLNPCRFLLNSAFSLTLATSDLPCPFPCCVLGSLSTIVLSTFAFLCFGFPLPDPHSDWSRIFSGPKSLCFLLAGGFVPSFPLPLIC